MHHLCAWYPWRLEKGIWSLEMELQIRNCTRVLWKSIHCPSSFWSCWVFWPILILFYSVSLPLPLWPPSDSVTTQQTILDVIKLKPSSARPVTDVTLAIMPSKFTHVVADSTHFFLLKVKYHSQCIRTCPVITHSPSENLDYLCSLPIVDNFLGTQDYRQSPW